MFIPLRFSSALVFNTGENAKLLCVSSDESVPPVAPRDIGDCDICLTCFLSFPVGTPTGAVGDFVFLFSELDRPRGPDLEQERVSDNAVISGDFFFQASMNKRGLNTQGGNAPKLPRVNHGGGG